MYGLLVFLHVLGAFLFVLAHGASILVSFRLRKERDPVRLAALFELSSTGINLMYVGLVILLLAGIAAGFLGGYWGRGWIWAALATLVVVMAFMYGVATPFYGRMRAAAGAPVPDQVVARMQPPPHARGPRADGGLQPADLVGGSRRHRPRGHHLADARETVLVTTRKAPFPAAHLQACDGTGSIQEPRHPDDEPDWYKLLVVLRMASENTERLPTIRG